MNSVEQSHCDVVVDGVGTSLLQTNQASSSPWHESGISMAAVWQNVVISPCGMTLGGVTLPSV